MGQHVDHLAQPVVGPGVGQRRGEHPAGEPPDELVPRRIRPVDVWKFEFPENFKMLVDSWNIKTNVWLRECIYKRVTPKGEKAGFKSSMLTYLTSAVWVRL